MLELLEHWVWNPVREIITRQQEDWQTVHGRASRPGDHVGGPGSDRCRAGEGGQPVPMLRVGGCGVNHRLLVLWSKELQAFRLAILHDALTESGNVSMAKNRPNALDKSIFVTVSFGELMGQESNDSLSGG